MASAVTISEMLQAEADALAAGWTEERLLLEAGQSLGRSIHQHFPTAGTAIAYLGKGHNAGDALVALNLLRDEYGWNVGYRPGFPIEDCAPLVQLHAKHIETVDEPTNTTGTLILLDGLLGTGSKGAPRAPLDALVAEMNALRDGYGAKVIAVDLPSGVDADTGEVADGAVTADITLMIANAKAGLMNSSCSSHTGVLGIVHLEALEKAGSSGLELIAPQSLDIAKAPRPHESHKGSSGKVSLLVGSEAYPGAAALAATGALRGGAGLVYVHVPRSIVETVRKLSPPEVIVSGYQSIDELDPNQADARVVGCGLGVLDKGAWEMLKTWIHGSSSPVVIDADALNTIVQHQGHGALAANHVITPHPGEFKRLAPDIADLKREEAVACFTECCLSTLLLKGSHSLVAKSGMTTRVNGTGHAGMASGGQGDLLAGVIGAQLAAGLDPYDAASLGAWLCGRAAELALQTDPPQSQESLTASDCAEWLGKAWQDWRTSSR